ncbi:MAG: hypothetical protein PHX68_01285 [Alphaproteobacteria bacterium]|nr:hypothetical protein [Alphaproteobacteria bacterium]
MPDLRCFGYFIGAVRLLEMGEETCPEPPQPVPRLPMRRSEKQEKKMKKICIKKTKWNIFWLFVAGFLFGVVLGLRQSEPPVPPQQTEALP